MQIDERLVGDVKILDLTGKMTLGEGDELLRDKVNSLVHQGHKKLVLNLEGVPYIDSAGLGEIVRGHAALGEPGEKLRLLHANERVRDLLTVAHLHPVVEMFDNEAAALASFS